MVFFPNIEGFTFHGQSPTSQPMQYLIGNFMPLKGVGVLVGEPGVGKSYLAIAMGAAVASSTPFLGQPVSSRGRSETDPRLAAGGGTLIISGEGHETYPNRVQAAYQGLPPTSRQQLADIGYPGLLPIGWMRSSNLKEDEIFESVLSNVVECAEQLKLCAPFDLRLIVIDTIPAVFGLRDENSAAEVQNIFSKLSCLSYSTGAFVLGVMHPRKRSRSGDIRGSGVFLGSPDLVLSAKKEVKGNGTLKVEKARDSGTQNSGMAYHLVPTTLPNGDEQAYIEGAPSISVNNVDEPTDSIRLTPTAQSVLRAFKVAVHKHPFEWTGSLGTKMLGATEQSIRAELAIMIPPTTTNKNSQQDKLRKTWRRGIEKLLQAELLDAFTHKDGYKVYSHIDDNLARNEYDE